MAWIPYEMPHCLAFGAVAENAWSTIVAENASGYEQRTQEWINWRCSYDLAIPPQLLDDFREVRAHWAMVRGRLNSFPMRDFTDFEIAVTEGVASYASPGVMQLGKLYGTSPYQYRRKITRLVPGTFAPLRNGSPMTAGSGAGQYAINNDTGQILIQPDQTRSITSHVVGTTHRFNITDFSPAPSPGGTVFASGVSGTAASLLNGVPLTVAAVGSGFITVTTNTAGLTASGGTLARRADASEITYSAEFLVPVRYDVDTLQAQAMTRSGSELVMQITGLRAIEVRE